jgi:hypothetical protein
MKLNLKLLLKDKNVLYIVLFIAISNLFAYLMFREFDAIIFFLLVGIISSYFSKNMIVIMLIAILSTNFLIGTKLLGKAVKEGMTTSTNDKDKKNDMKTTTDTSKMTTGNNVNMSSKTMPIPVPASAAKKPSDQLKDKKSEKFTTLSPASVHEGEDIEHKVDYASTLEAAYDNLDKLLGSDAIRTMTADTQRLAEKQKLLMGNIKQLEPMMQTASKMLDGLNVGQMGDMLTGLESKFAKFTGSSK